VLCIIALFFSVPLLFIGCSFKSEKEKVKSLTYADRIAIEMKMQHSRNLDNPFQTHINNTVKNNGDKTIIELLGKVLLYSSDGMEVGRLL